MTTHALAALAVWVGAASLGTLALTVLDKARARRGGARTPERTLLAWALLGGSPGLVLGMLLARHKTAKPSFLAKTALVLATHAVLAWWIVTRH